MDLTCSTFFRFRDTLRDPWNECVDSPAWSLWHVTRLQGLHDLTNVEGPSWKANVHFRVIGLYITSRGNMDAFNYVTLMKYSERKRFSQLSTRDRNLRVEFMTQLKDGEKRLPHVNGVEINSSG